MICVRSPALRIALRENMGDNQIFEEDLIIKVLLNEASAEEVVKLEAWINENPLNHQKFLELQGIWGTLEVQRSVSVETTRKDWISISQRIEQEKKFSISGKVKLLVINISKIAAMLLIGSVGYFVSFGLMDAVSSQSYTSITAPNGSKTEILLPDGSNVMLNGGSTLRYPEQFLNDHREVYLEGEAFFNVKKADQQFLVKTKEITIKVYGTSFNVMSYNDALVTEATLEEGKIGITVNSDKGENKEEVWIEPNQQAIWYHANSIPQQQEIAILKGIDVQVYTAWKEGILIIKSEALKDFAVKLERRYGVKILFGNEEVKAIKFTGTIKNETVEQVMQLIKLVSNIEYSIKENVITIGKQK